MKFDNDTIAAIATAPGEAGIAVVRLSGPASLKIADQLIDCKGAPPSERESPAIVHGVFRDGDQNVDEVLVLVMRAPRSYTKEDVVEIQCHGGYLVSRKILRCVLAAGARSAEAGEFTARAFLNGRLDLVQAESIADVIHAQSEKAAAAAFEQLQGKLSRDLEDIYAHCLEQAALLETALDFSDQDIDPINPDDQIPDMDSLIRKVDELIDTYDEGQLLRHGARVVISGRPNVGKSTLLNKLLESDRAIVSDIPGTTRDTIQEQITLDGFPVVLTDTAGLRDSQCQIEAEGIRRTQDEIQRANIHIYIIDASQPLSERDSRFLQGRDPKTSILVKNKIDYGRAETTDVHGFTTVETCLLRDEGVTDIRAAIRSKLERNIDIAGSQHPAISARHYNALKKCCAELEAARQCVHSRSPGYEVLASAHLRSAAEEIGWILGKNYDEDLLNTVFSKFCIGK